MVGTTIGFSVTFVSLLIAKWGKANNRNVFVKEALKNLPINARVGNVLKERPK